MLQKVTSLLSDWLLRGSKNVMLILHSDLEEDGRVAASFSKLLIHVRAVLKDMNFVLVEIIEMFC